MSLWNRSNWFRKCKCPWWILIGGKICKPGQVFTWASWETCSQSTCWEMPRHTWRLPGYWLSCERAQHKLQAGWREAAADVLKMGRPKDGEGRKLSRWLDFHCHPLLICRVLGTVSPSAFQRASFLCLRSICSFSIHLRSSDFFRQGSDSHGH